MEKEYLTVKEFAEKAGVSVQSVYKKIRKANNPIQPYLKKVDGVQYVSNRALTVLYNVDQSQGVEDHAEQQAPLPGSSEEKAPDQTGYDRLIDLLEKQLEDQRRQLEEKDRQLEAKDDQINKLMDQINNSAQLLNQQQQLMALNQTALLENKKPEEKKPGLLRRLFGNK